MPPSWSVMEESKRIERSIITTYRKTIWNRFIEGVKKYRMVNEGDRIAVCLSGGKDSALLVKCMQQLQRYGDCRFDLQVIVMDPGYSPENRKKIEENCARMGIEPHIFETDVFASVDQVEKNPCYLCARMRRGHLYAFAESLGCNKIALGHHFDDVIETTLLGLLYGAQVQTMLPKLHSTNFTGMELIRPLYCVKEKDIVRFAKYNQLEFLQCACRVTSKEAGCDSESASKRKYVKKMIEEMTKNNSQVPINIFRAMENVKLAEVIGYTDGSGYHNFMDNYDKESIEYQ